MRNKKQPKLLRDLSTMRDDPNVQAGLDALERAHLAQSLTERERALSMFWTSAMVMVLRDFPTEEGRREAVYAVTAALSVLASKDEFDHVLDATITANDIIGGSG